MNRQNNIIIVLGVITEPTDDTDEYLVKKIQTKSEELVKMIKNLNAYREAKNDTANTDYLDYGSEGY